MAAERDEKKTDQELLEHIRMNKTETKYEMQVFSS